MENGFGNMRCAVRPTVEVENHVIHIRGKCIAKLEQDGHSIACGFRTQFDEGRTQVAITVSERFRIS